MSQIDAKIAAHSLNPDAIIALFTLDATAVGGAVLRFVQGTQANAVVSYGGLLYNPIDIEFVGLETSGQGALPSPSLRFSNTDDVIGAIVNSWGDLNGATVSRIRTFAKFLDNGSQPDPNAYFGPDIYLVEQKSSETPTEITWELAAAIDQQGRMIPNRVAIRDTCLWRYRIHTGPGATFDTSKAQCPYTGSSYWDAFDQPVTDPAEDVPSRSVNCCKLRFGAGKPWPFGGFPGMPRAR